MKLDKKGMTIIEIIVSVALVSIVLIFLMNLFLKVRTLYEQSKIQADYDILSSNIIKLISEDIDNYGLKSLRYENSSTKDAVILTFDQYRPSSLSENIVKVLRISDRKESSGKITKVLSYGYEAIYTNNRTNEERLANINREIPDDAILGSEELIQIKSSSLSSTERIVEIKVPLSTPSGNIYDLNIYSITGATIIEEPEFLITNKSYYFTYNATQKTFKSTNQSANSTTAETTLELVSAYTRSIKIEWTVDSEETYDGLEIKKNGTSLLSKTTGQNKSGSFTVTLSVGDKLQFLYSKNATTSKYSDTATIKMVYSNTPVTPIETPNTYRVYFEATGGVTSISSKNVTSGSTYGTLPTPTRIGYEFKGWFTSITGGTEIKSSTVASLSASQTLYAQWTERIIDVTVTFEAVNGTVDPKTKTARVGATYGDLPTPVYDDGTELSSSMKFEGWYTELNGGTKITSDTIVDNAENHVLYARYYRVDQQN